jgi:hypothetical protein
MIAVETVFVTEPLIAAAPTTAYRASSIQFDFRNLTSNKS